MAEREGFEPSEPFGSHALQACAIDHSATSPTYSDSLPDDLNPPIPHCPPERTQHGKASRGGDCRSATPPCFRCAKARLAPHMRGSARTPETLITPTRTPIARIRPLCHLSCSGLPARVVRGKGRLIPDCSGRGQCQAMSGGIVRRYRQAGSRTRSSRGGRSGMASTRCVATVSVPAGATRIVRQPAARPASTSFSLSPTIQLRARSS
jgi:hypothetical protein